MEKGGGGSSSACKSQNFRGGGGSNASGSEHLGLLLPAGQPKLEILAVVSALAQPLMITGSGREEMELAGGRPCQGSDGHVHLNMQLCS